MVVSDPKGTQLTSASSPISRARSLSGSIKNLFKSSGANNTPTESIQAITNSSILEKLSESKKAELSSSRGPSVSGLNINTSLARNDDSTNISTQSRNMVLSPALPQAPKQQVNAPQSYKTSVSSTSSSRRTSGEKVTMKHATSSENSIHEFKNRPDSEEDETKFSPPRVADMDYSIDTILDHHETIKNIKRNDSIKLSRSNKNSSGSTNVSRSNSLSRVHSTPSSYHSGTSQPNRIRPHADTISAGSFQNLENDFKLILQVDNFKVYKNGVHEHNLKIMPIVKNSVENSEGDDDLNKQKSSFSIATFFKSHKNDDGISHEVETLGDLNDAISLIPNMRNTDFYAAHRRGDNKIQQDSDSISELKEPSSKVVNRNAAIGADELKLINTLSERIHEGIKGKKSADLLRENISHPHKFSDLYGKSMGIVLGHGAYGVVRLFAKETTPQENTFLNTYCNGKKLFFAVKELKPKSNEQMEKFSTRITSEFIIGHSLSHTKYKRSENRSSPNIVKVLDLLEVSNGSFIEVLEFCPAGDLYSLLTRKSKLGMGLHPLEADCFMKQLLNGVQYMHYHGVAHCDLKPENILFHPSGLLKICDFGTSCVFQTAWEKNVHFQTGAIGSEPYVAPEEFIHGNEYDPRLADCWSAGVVYCSMVLGHYLWKIAIKDKDSLYKSFCEEMDRSKEFYVFEEMRHVNHEINRLRKIALYRIFQSNPEKRYPIDQILQSSWMKNTKCCVDYKPHTKH